MYLHVREGKYKTVCYYRKTFNGHGFNLILYYMVFFTIASKLLMLAYDFLH